jgi:hypothetical protein
MGTSVSPCRRLRGIQPHGRHLVATGPQLGGGGGERGRQLLTVPAPRRVEVHKERLARQDVAAQLEIESKT